MGGSALKVQTSRMNKRDFNLLAQKCLDVVQSVCPDVRCTVVPSYFSKESFGDLDVLVSKEGFDREKVAHALKPVEVFQQKNAIYCSMGVTLEEGGQVYQVDFIEESAHLYDFALAYYGFNDLGNLLGILVAQSGLKLKHNGLYYYVKEGDEVLAELEVSHDFNDVLLFLGLEPSRFSEGFDTLESLFDFVASSRFFGPEVYLLENRNHRSRTRDRKRPTYQAFLQYCAENKKGSVPAHVQGSAFEQACRFFKGFQAQLDVVSSQRKSQEKQKKVFNGELVGSLTGLKGKELGDFLANLRLSQESNGLLAAVNSGNDEAVAEVVKREFRQLAVEQVQRDEAQIKP